MLLEKGAKVNLQDENKNTPLHAAAKKGCVSMIDLFNSVNANLDIQNKSGETPLHIAVKNNRKDIASKLMELGSDINIRDNSGKKPLDYVELSQRNQIHNNRFASKTKQPLLKIHTRKNSKQMIM
jgi:ankyrin repeat protein